jgi:chaperone modulatory protein CbpM
MATVTTARYRVMIRMTSEERSEPLTLAELAERCECEVELVRGLVSVGLIEPIGGLPEEPQFHLTAVPRLSRALRLRRDFNLNLDALVLVVELLDRIEELEERDRTRVES